MNYLQWSKRKHATEGAKGYLLKVESKAVINAKFTIVRGGWLHHFTGWSLIVKKEMEASSVPQTGCADGINVAMKMKWLSFPTYKELRMSFYTQWELASQCELAQKNPGLPRLWWWTKKKSSLSSYTESMMLIFSIKVIERYSYCVTNLAVCSLPLKNPPIAEITDTPTSPIKPWIELHLLRYNTELWTTHTFPTLSWASCDRNPSLQQSCRD